MAYSLVHYGAILASRAVSKRHRVAKGKAQKRIKTSKDGLQPRGRQKTVSASRISAARGLISNFCRSLLESPLMKVESEEEDTVLSQPKSPVRVVKRKTKKRKKETSVPPPGDAEEENVASPQQERPATAPAERTARRQRSTKESRNGRVRSRPPTAEVHRPPQRRAIPRGFKASPYADSGSSGADAVGVRVRKKRVRKRPGAGTSL